MQLLSFSKTLEQAASTEMLTIAGSDYGLEHLCQWNKISAPHHFPSQYTAMLKKAKRVIVVRSNDPGTDCPIQGKYRNVHVNSTLKKLRPDLWPDIEKQLKDPNSDYSQLKQWEWGLPDATVQAIKTVWNNLGKKDRSHPEMIPSPETMCAFTNDVGSSNDSRDAREFLKEMGLNKRCWFSNGLDSPGASCMDIYENRIPSPHEKIMDWMVTTAPYKNHRFVPLSIQAVI